eukprot:TRINITY_DN31646_c0_g1_i6.p2 TRINITY_DN31646_c0_g1~~TRINITY_DN31646_c0_g1_i6.p2  ORF type:complete len:151 (+),score=1.18 TRINITY_DN31646_c0_g1_i6:186-638(+)
MGVGSTTTIEREVVGCFSVLHIVDDVLLPASASSKDQSTPFPSLLYLCLYSHRHQLAMLSPIQQQVQLQTSLYPRRVFPRNSNNLAPSFPAIALSSNVLSCWDVSTYKFFVSRGLGLGDVWFFDVMFVLSKLSNQVYFNSLKLAFLILMN